MLNDTQISDFNFDKNDIIQCEFNPKKKILSFINLNTNKNYELNIEIDKKKELVPCATLFKNGDSVRIESKIEVDEKFMEKCYLEVLNSMNILDKNIELVVNEYNMKK